MGFMDKISNMFGGDKKPQTETVKGPSTVLRENGIDPSNLKFDFNADGSLGVSGTVENQADADRIIEVLEGIPSVTTVSNNVQVAPATPEPAPAVEPNIGATLSPTQTTVEPEVSVEPQASTEARTYTVKSGDTLWAISEEMYGSGAKYKKIFEANTDQLEDPDKIRPGQVLIIPDLDD